MRREMGGCGGCLSYKSKRAPSSDIHEVLPSLCYFFVLFSASDGVCSHFLH